jgi:glutamate transport system substrate-binding protein
MSRTSPLVARHIGSFLAAGTLFVAATVCSAADTNPKVAAPVSGSASSQGKEFPAGTTMKRLADAGTIRVGIKFDQPLFGLMGLDGKPGGLDVEIAKIISQALGIPADHIKWIETPSAVREQALKQGKVDIIVATYTMTAQRAKQVTFAGPYYEATQRIIVPSGSPITGPADFKANPKLKLCSVSGATSAEHAKDYLADWHSQLVLFDTWSKCGSALQNKQVDAITSDSGTLSGIIVKSKGKFQFVGPSMASEPDGIGLPKGDVAFCEFIDNALEAAVADGRYKKAWESTLGEADPTVPPFPKPVPCE